MKRYIIFFRAEEKFVPPRKTQFPFKESDVELLTVNVGDTYDAIQSNVSKIIETIAIVQGFAETIYLCGAIPLGLAWLLRDLVNKVFSGANFVWLQFARDTKSPGDTKQYEVWPDLELDNIY